MIKIYKKPTHTNRYLIFNSAHSMSQKQGVKCLLKRAQSQLNSTQANKTLETSKILEALKKNDYRKWSLKCTVKSLKTKTNLSLADENEIKTRVVLPYVPRYFEALSKILRNVGILVSSKPHLTLTLSLPRLSIDDLVFSVFLSNFFKLSYKISLLNNRFVTLFFIRFS